MTMYVITEGIGTGRMAIVSGTGERFEFPRADGGLIAAMLDEEFPACEGCEDREDVCGECGFCPECVTSGENDCDACAEVDDEDYDDGPEPESDPDRDEP